MTNNYETKVTKISVEMFERISEVRKQPEYDRIKYMVGVKLTDGRDCAFHTVNYLDCDIATGDMFGFIENEEEIKVVRVKRANILHRA